MRILIVKLSSLGDLFHALPTVRTLKQGLGAAIDWVAQPEYTDLVRCFDDVEHVIPFPRRKLFTGAIPFLRQLREQHYDYVVDLQGLVKSASITAMARGGRKIGPSANREGAHLFYGEVAGVKNKDRHAAEELLDVARHLELPLPDPLPFPVTFPPHERPGPTLQVAICPCSRAAGKDWPPERFAETAVRLLEEHPDTRFHLVGSPADHATCDLIARAIGPAAQNHAGKTTLLALGGLLRVMDLLITVDSGPMHMAAAIGTPTLALFGPTSPLRTGPYGDRHRVVESSFDPGNKRISKKVRERDMRYIEAITVAEVSAAAHRMISNDRRNPTD